MDGINPTDLWIRQNIGEQQQRTRCTIHPVEALKDPAPGDQDIGKTEDNLSNQHRW
jgi:hypothetical protein